MFMEYTGNSEGYVNRKKNIGYEVIRQKQWDGPPYSYSVKVNGKLKRMSGFDEEHIKNQLYPRKASMIRKVKDV